MISRPTLVLFLAVLPWILWSAWRPYDRLTWWLEVIPVFIGYAALFIGERKGWRFSNFVLVWLGLHMVLLLVGGHYTYALTPLGDWMKDWFGFTRNHYDRIGHLLQGIVPALVCRELLVRNRVFARRGWLNFTVISFCMGFSACYELVEWAAALISAEAAESFLGTQGDGWDTQMDMFLAGVGSLVTLFLLKPFHDRSMAAVSAGHGN